MLGSGVKHSMDSLDYTLWSIWPQLTWPHRTFCLILFFVGLYVVVSAARILMRLRRAIKSRGENGSSDRQALDALRHRSENLGRLITATLYLFGVAFFMSMPSVVYYVGDGRNSALVEIISRLMLRSVFAGNVFFVLLLLHALQAFVCGRVHSYE